mmetsp:Transcript_17112/g.35715  ORF Transcript_17112/g.35715 Transcript_17112/m.35715 type:complete len:768 (+) Transcript_17112:318-2621(+)
MYIRSINSQPHLRGGSGSGSGGAGGSGGGARLAFHHSSYQNDKRVIGGGVIPFRRGGLGDGSFKPPRQPTTMANPIIANFTSNFKAAPQCSTDGRSNNAFLKENNCFRPVTVQDNGRVAVTMTNHKSQEHRPAPQAFHVSSLEFGPPAHSLSWGSSQSANSVGTSSYNSSSMTKSNENSNHFARMIHRNSPRGPAELSDSPNSFLSINFNNNNNDARKPQVFDNKKKKTELCKHFQKNGSCPYGAGCNYAHGEKDRVSFENVEDMVRAGVIVDSTNYMCRPCIIFVSTGSCPYGTRCKFLHDPNIQGDENRYPPWLEHCTKFKKKEPEIIPDRLYHSKVNAIHQENPLIDPFIWEKCRPNIEYATSSENSKEWLDTYNLVCNAGVPIFSGSNRFKSHKMSEAQKIAIVLSMHRESRVKIADNAHNQYLDFTYVPTHCINGQPCMILQSRYFRLLDCKSTPAWGNKHGEDRNVSSFVSIKDLVEEISEDAYHDWTIGSSNSMIRVHEVAFDSKGKRSANQSIWFDADHTPCSNNKAKKLSKKGEDHWQLNDRSGALFCMPKNDTFECSLPSISPYVCMVPMEDSHAGLKLIEKILEHRLGSILHTQGLSFKKFPLGKTELDTSFVELKKEFTLMKVHSEKWSWPKTSNMDHICKATEERNQTAYFPRAPPRATYKAITPAIWKSFIQNLCASDDELAHKKRLNVFRSITAKNKQSKHIPLIRPSHYKTGQSIPAENLSEATWKELLHGEKGAWKNAVDSYKAKLQSIH